MNKQLKEQIQSIIDTWEGFNLSDVNGIIELRRTLSTYYYNLSEYKAINERGFLTCETDRKDYFNARKIYYINLGETATKATSQAEVDCGDKRFKEVKYEREYKYAKDILNSLDHVLNAMSSAIRQGENENKQGGFHT